MSDLFQTSLYFFSALLQADAAILGFGAIFIIFKIQALDSMRERLMNSYYYYKGAAHAENVNTLEFSNNKETIAKILNNAKGLHFENYKKIICIHGRLNEIRNSIKAPIRVISIHAIMCALLLFLSQFIQTINCLQIGLIIVTIIGFCIGIYLASNIAISLTAKKDSFDIERLLPGIYEKMNE